jgi:hypothetical protein
MFFLFLVIIEENYNNFFKIFLYKSKFSNNKFLFILNKLVIKQKKKVKILYIIFFSNHNINFLKQKKIKKRKGKHVV